MPNRYTERILDYIADRRYEPRSLRELADELSIPQDQVEMFGLAVDQLLQENRVVRAGAGQIVLPPMGKEMVGTFRLHERGFGFVIPESPTEHGDLFVPPGANMDAITGDRVRAKVRKDPRGRDGRCVGRIVEVIQHTDRSYAGTLTKKGSTFLVVVDGKALHNPVVIRDPHAKNAKPGDKVVIELIDRGSQQAGELPEGVISKVLGEAGEPDVETLAVMYAYNLPQAFTDSVLDDARRAAASFDDQTVPPDRQDLTDLLICTIDPPDAKDYDDAISLRELKNGGYELGVHIADVASFVTPDSPLDSEAYRRGNSTYLPRRVVPMLPELLSNGVCSLQEGVNRFAKSCFIEYDAQGHVQKTRFSRSVIRSQKRLTYLEAQALIDADIREAIKHSRSSNSKYLRPLIQQLKLMDKLAKVIRTRRLRGGMIVLGLPTVELIFDESGRVIDAEPEDDAFTHTMIEMFMVEANEAAARLFDSLKAPMIRRIHADPDPYDLSELRQFTRIAGYNIPARPNRMQLQSLLDSVRGQPAQYAVHLAVLKTLSKAEYSPALIGHFALASEHYTHFTSPIRRYADLVVHRGIDTYLTHAATKLSPAKLKRNVAADLPDELRLTEVGKHCSTTEVNSESAERELRTYLVLELLSDHLGEDCDGTVTGVTGNGVFIQIDKYLVDGFVPITDLPGAANERWQLNRGTGALVAQRSGKTITIGERFTIRIARIDLPRRQLDLVVLDPKRKPKRTLKQVKHAPKEKSHTKKTKRTKKKLSRRK